MERIGRNEERSERKRQFCSCVQKAVSWVGILRLSLEASGERTRNPGCGELQLGIVLTVQGCSQKTDTFVLQFSRNQTLQG